MLPIHFLIALYPNPTQRPLCPGDGDYGTKLILCALYPLLFPNLV